ncbi:MAG TPA: hypothetical protein VGM19_09715 [Armatimonadota bacterium]|jgi:chromosome condensin MukBEF ATPase and DNA-binding subunit MukB
MDIFDRARKALGDLAQSASSSAQVLQLQAKMGEVETNLDRQYREAGRRARELWRAHGQLTDSDFELFMTRISDLEREMERLRAQVNEVQSAEPAGPPVCADCGQELDADDAFCRGCGRAKG